MSKKRKKLHFYSCFLCCKDKIFTCSLAVLCCELTYSHGEDQLQKLGWEILKEVLNAAASAEISRRNLGIVDLTGIFAEHHKGHASNLPNGSNQVVP